MAKKKKILNNHLKQSEKESLHLSEFSQGKPYEFSLNVLENKSIAQQEKKPGFIKRLFSHDKGSSKGLPDTPYISNGQDLFGSSTKVSDEKKEDKTAKSNSAVANKKEKHNIHVKDKTTGNKVSVKSDKTPGQKPFLDESSRAEIKRRQHKRHIRGRISVAVLILAAVALLAVGGNYLYKEFEKQQSNIDLLKTSFSYLEESDKTLVELDSFFQESFNDRTIENAEALLKQLPDARQKLGSALYYANLAHDGLHDSTTDKEASEYALNSIAAREILYTVSEKRLNEDKAAKQAFDKMNQVESSVNEGNSLIVQASKVIANTTPENVATSTKYITSAKDYFSSAQVQLAEVKAVYSGADVSLIDEYISKKMELCDYALMSNEAILVQDKTAAEEANQKYNTADEEAVALAELFPKEFNQPVIDVYQSNTADLITEYTNARNDAARNDSNLREYLGVNTQ